MQTNDIVVLLTTGAIYHRYAYYGQGSGPIFMSNVRCSGSETHLVNCSHSTSSAQYCSHYRNIGVECPGEFFFFGICKHMKLLLLCYLWSQFLQFLAMTLALPMVTFVLLEAQTSIRVEWRSAITDSGGRSVMTYGAHQMPGWPVGSLASQE